MTAELSRLSGEFMKVLIVDDNEPMRRMVRTIIDDLVREAIPEVQEVVAIQ